MHAPFRKSSCHRRPRTPNNSGGELLDTAILNGGALVQIALDDHPDLRATVATTVAVKLQTLEDAKCPN